MILTFIAPSAPHPIGGVVMLYEFAAAMAARGHEVHLFHVPFWKTAVEGPDDLGWFPFTDDIVHHFPTEVPTPPADVPAADIFFGWSPSAHMPAHAGLPVVFIQGYRMLGDGPEDQAFHAPCPKVCVARWLVDVGIGLGVSANQLVHVPLGLRHEKYRVVRPLDARPPSVAFCYSSHVQKGAEMALDVLREVKEGFPELEAVAFGSEAPAHEFPHWLTYHRDPPQELLVEEIYNRARVFLVTSDVEGFGLPAVEAMACGATLVTTDNGGCHDYAVHGETALIGPIGDRTTMAVQVRALLSDPPRQLRLAEAGRRRVLDFHWDHSAELLEQFLQAYLSDPDAYRGSDSASASSNQRWNR